MCSCILGESNELTGTGRKHVFSPGKIKKSGCVDGWGGGVTCILTSLQKPFFAAVNVTVKWTSGLKEQLYKAFICCIIVMYCGYSFHCTN